MTMQHTPRRLIIVLGMHRSGTSAIARGLMALGADLGENLLPPVAQNNERGFWEDRDVVALSDAVLDRLGLAWDSTSPIDRERLAGAGFDDLRLRALDFMRSRLDASRVFAIKDPRLSRLMPFWSGVFQRLDARIDFVLSLRNPISVAQSLQRRDGFAPIKSHLLWLQHAAGMVLDTSSGRIDAAQAAPRRVVVSFERLLGAPLAELQRLSRALDLDFDPSSAAVRDYLSGFLDRDLEHARYAESDLGLDPALPPAVAEVFTALARSADEPDGGLDAGIESRCRRHDDDMTRLRPLLQFASESDRLARSLAATSSQRERELQATKDLLADRQARVVALSKLLDLLENKLPAGFGRHLATLAGDVVRESRQPVLDGLSDTRDSLRSALVESEARVLDRLHQAGDGLRRDLGELYAHSRSSDHALHSLLDRIESCIGSGGPSLQQRIESLAGENASARREVAALLQASRTWERDLAERSREIGKLSQLLLEAQSAGHVARQARDEAVNGAARVRAELSVAKQAETALRQRLVAVERSWSWQLTAPLRWPARISIWLHAGGWRYVRDARAIARSGLFDAEWYLRTYTDVATIAMPPVQHYLKHGARELRDPGPGFSTSGYLRANPDVAESGMNPLLHYLRHGRDEGRATGAAAR